MPKRLSRRRLAAAGVLVAVLTAAAVVAVGMRLNASTATPVAGGEMPNALAGHLAKLKQSVPGTAGGMAEEGPASAAADAYEARAYPDEAISVSDAAAARTSWAAHKGRPFPKGKGRPGTWVSIGPSEAVYPDSPFLTSFLYVPNRYVAGGRTTDLAIADRCVPGDCRLYVTPAGGGIWRTKNALDGQPHWEYLGGPLGINAAGSVEIDRNDPTGNTIYVGTGEANICGSGCASGTGIYRSTDGGDTWTLLGDDTFAGLGVGDIRIKPGDPDTIYAATTTGLRGMTAVCCSGVSRPTPGAGKWGLYKSTDGGANWSFLHNGAATAAECTGTIPEYNNAMSCSPRGVRHIELDPSDPDTVYASSFARGIWRSTDGGATWTQIKAPLVNHITDRAAIAVTELADGSTRMYVYEGWGGSAPYSRLFRSDDANAATPTFQDMTAPTTASPGWAWNNICAPQCWYDVFVYTPTGHPDIVYAGGDYSYGEHIANKRAVILSTDAGVSGTDMTMDGTDPLHPNGLHPDQHAIVTNPNNPLQFFEANDGGVMRSSGELVDRSDWCDLPGRGGNTPTTKMRCRQMLSAIPSKLEGMNHGLPTLQWIRVSASPHNVNVLTGGTQDNGTWETLGNTVKWENTMIGDGGWAGFDAKLPDFRYHNYYYASPEVTFDKGAYDKWIWVADPLWFDSFVGGTEFYSPVISDPKVSGTMFAGTTNVWRTKTHGLGDMDYEEAHRRCNSFSGAYDGPCGDWQIVAAPKLNSATRGDRAGGNVAAIERTTADTSTAWAATTTGRVFISKNADAEPASAVAWSRLDDDSAIDPNRFVSSIYVDPANANRAWVSYSGYAANTPSTPGHVFVVEYNPATDTSTWTDISHDWGDLPVTDLVRDDLTGDLYAASDFGVSLLKSGTTTWVQSAPGMPNVEVPSLDIRVSERVLIAGTHGLSTWRLNLPKR